MVLFPGQANLLIRTPVVKPDPSKTRKIAKIIKPHAKTTKHFTKSHVFCGKLKEKDQIFPMISSSFCPNAVFPTKFSKLTIKHLFFILKSFRVGPKSQFRVISEKRGCLCNWPIRALRQEMFCHNRRTNCVGTGCVKKCTRS